MNNDIFIVEEFYTSPKRVREFALSLEYTDFGGKKNFLGMESVHSFPPLNVEDRFAELVQADIMHTSKEIFGKFRIAQKNEERRTKIHFDRCAFAANIYLTPGATSSSGLGIYRHISTGLEQVPTSEQLSDLGYNSIDEFDREVILPDSMNPEKWERMELFEPRFNTCIIIPGSKYFHAAESGSGNSIETARLSQHFFLNRTS